MTLNIIMITNKIKINIIAEIGVNHNGNINLAKKLIKSAKKCGADFVKFQNWKAEDLVTEKAEMANYQIKNTKKNIKQLDLLKPLELSKKNYYEIENFAKKNKIKFLSSPFDEKSFEFLANKINSKIIKIPSGEINNYLMLSKVRLNKHKILLSTGMSTLKEITNTLNFIAKRKIYHFKNGKVRINNKKKIKYLRKKICVLHCVTDYPVNEKFANLKAIKTLSNSFQLPVGYSDHTLGTCAPLIAASLGSVFIEKHITLDKSFTGPDHKASLIPSEFKKMVQMIRSFEKMFGNGIKKPQKCEIRNIKVAKKSIVAKKKIKKGELFTINNITVKRPAGGKNPSHFFKILGKTAKKNYMKDQKI